jgi:cell wall-associated NlpC family hydrolase
MTAGEILPEKTTLLGSATERANEMIFYALSHLGVRYKYGGDNPDKGFDCSGLVRWVFNRTWGMMLPRRSDEIARSGKEISRDQLKPGDLVFFNTLRRAYSHVGIYLGDGRFLHAPSAGGQVRVENMNVPYWQQRWNGARRLEQSETLNQSSETSP